MGKHITEKELDVMLMWQSQGMTPKEIRNRLLRKRATAGERAPSLVAVRRALRGQTFKRSKMETRGRKQILSMANMHALDETRKKLNVKADNDYEVTWDGIVCTARVPHVDRSTASKCMKAAGFDVAWHTPRTKPSRTEIDEKQRMNICSKLRQLPTSFWTSKMDAYIDCKAWPIPRTTKGRKFLNKLKIRGHLRTRSEGLNKEFTKPDKRKHHMNVGPNAKVFAAIVGNRVRVWHYLPAVWSGSAAVNVYKTVLAPALTKFRGAKRQFDILEDNDPTGFKAAVSIAAKKELKIKPIKFPTYSPDLNPCDYALWQEVERRMVAQVVPRKENVEGFKARLRRTALAIPAPVIKKMLASMKTRTCSVYEHKGGHIPRD